MTTFTQDQWIILALVFVLGLLLGMFLTAGGRKKWKTRYHDERKRADTLERDHRERLDSLKREHEGREKEWRERDSLRGAAGRDERHPDERRPL